jgi:acyl-CoA synthetase (AMP-forming)/AMP-acid ligase II
MDLDLPSLGLPSLGFPSLELPHLTIPALVARAASRFADAEAIADTQDGGRRMSYAELTAEIDRTAAALVASGVAAGEAVAVWAPNTWEWVVAGLAVHRAGAVLVPVNTRFKGREAGFVLAKSRARLLFTVNGFLGVDYVGMLADADQQLPDLADIVVMRGPEPAAAPAGPRVTGFDAFQARATEASAAEARARADEVRAEDTCNIMFTSGTTGMPKGVMIGHGALVRGFAEYADVLGVRPGDRYLIINPFFHAFGFNGGIIPCVMHGATILPHAVFDPTEVLRKIEAERVTVLPGPPAIFQALLNSADLPRFDVSSLRSCITGAASIPVEMVLGMRDRLRFENVLTAYGMTETSGIASLCRPEDDPETIATTSGRALEGVELRIVGPDGGELPRGQAGELLVRGWNVMKGYLDDPQHTAEAIDAGGWLHTGDIAVMDDRGYIDITDRMKDMFIVGGFNAYPAEIERMMIEHPAIGQVAVVGVPDDRLGEVGGAFVIPTPDGTLDPAEVTAWCRERMANYKVPRYVWVVDALPLNPSGKVLKFALRERAQEELAART